MGQAAEQPRTAKQTSLQRTLTSALNELGVEAALVAIFDREDGPPVAQGYRGFSPREVQTILRTLSAQDMAALNVQAPSGDGESLRAARLRMITPAAKSLLGVPLRHKERTYGVLVIGRKESATFSKKEKSLI
ncbi:MAG: GAF domain-containing protein, partial [Nitrospirota bacterium]